MLLPECNRLSFAHKHYLDPKSSLVVFMGVHLGGAKLGGKFGPSLGMVQSNPGDLLGAGKAEGEQCKAAGAVLAGGRASRGVGVAKTLGQAGRGQIMLKLSRRRRKELLGKAWGQRNCRALHNVGREPGRAEAGQVMRAGEPVFGVFSPSWAQSPPDGARQRPAPLEEKSVCAAGAPQPYCPRATGHREDKSVRCIGM